jgi:diguanylate cyclase (GGDEF)-like protein
LRVPAADGAAPGARRLASFGGLAGLSIIAAVVLFAACTALMLENREDSLRRDDQMARNLVILAGQTVAREIDQIDGQLRMLQTALQYGAGAVAAPRAGVSGQPGGGLIVVEPDGRLIASSGPASEAKGFLAQVPRLLAEVGPPVDGLSVGGPFKPPGSPVAVLALIRRCAPGQCGGAVAVVAPLSMQSLNATFGRLALGRRGSLVLLTEGGTLILRLPHFRNAIGRVVVSPGDLEGATGTHIVHRERRSGVDHVLRRYSIGQVGDLRLVIAVGVAVSELASGVGLLAAIIGVLVLLLSATIVGLTLVLVREVRRTTEAERDALTANRQLAELARTDQLTGLLNRRGFDEHLSREWRRARRNNRPVALLLLDADNFKRYNDKNGHQAGDGVLRLVSRCITDAIRRPGDIAARYGGEEFAVVLPDTEFEGAGLIAENIRSSIAALALAHEGNGEAGVVTVSIGLSYHEPGRTDSEATLVGSADEALYEAKNSGRNRVVSRRVV